MTDAGGEKAGGSGTRATVSRQEGPSESAGRLRRGILQTCRVPRAQCTMQAQVSPEKLPTTLPSVRALPVLFAPAGALWRPVSFRTPPSHSWGRAGGCVESCARGRFSWLARHVPPSGPAMKSCPPDKQKHNQKMVSARDATPQSRVTQGPLRLRPRPGEASASAPLAAGPPSKRARTSWCHGAKKTAGRAALSGASEPNPGPNPVNTWWL